MIRCRFWSQIWFFFSSSLVIIEILIPVSQLASRVSVRLRLMNCLITDDNMHDTGHALLKCMNCPLPHRLLQSQYQALISTSSNGISAEHLQYMRKCSGILKNGVYTSEKHSFRVKRNRTKLPWSWTVHVILWLSRREEWLTSDPDSSSCIDSENAYKKCYA